MKSISTLACKCLKGLWIIWLLIELHLFHFDVILIQSYSWNLICASVQLACHGMIRLCLACRILFLLG